MKKNILVIVAHPDDETIGMGGTIAKHTSEGDFVNVITMTDGVSSRDKDLEVSKDARKTSLEKVSKILGFKWVTCANFPDNAMDSVPLLTITKFIEGIKQSINPNIIYTHSGSDLNIDHRIVSQATITAFRPQPEEMWEEIRAFEIPSATDFSHKSIAAPFSPNLYINISDYWPLKLAALKEFQQEMRPAPHTRSFEGLHNLAKYRGNQSGLNYAESFEIIRRINR